MCVLWGGGECEPCTDEDQTADLIRKDEAEVCGYLVYSESFGLQKSYQKKITSVPAVWGCSVSECVTSVPAT